MLQRFLLAQQLAHIEFLEESIAQLTAEIERALGPFDQAAGLLQTIPGIDTVTAAALEQQVRGLRGDQA